MVKTTALLLDLDGTLTDLPINYPRMRARLRNLFRKHGISASFSPLLEGIDSACAKAQAKSGRAAAARLRKEAFAIIDNEEVKAAKLAKPVEGALNLLKLAHTRRMKVAVVSRNCRDCVRTALKRMGAKGKLAIIARDDVKKPKPDPEQVLLALRLLKTKPQGAVLVGDTWHDAEAGSRARIGKVFILGGGRLRKTLKCSAIESLAQLPDLLE